MVMSDNHKALFGLILGSGDEGRSEDVVSELMTVLLRIAAEEKSEEVSQACCACLGELGAIDPARVNM